MLLLKIGSVLYAAPENENENGYCIIYIASKEVFRICSLVHAYAVGRDMEEALCCVRKMKDEGIELSLVTYSILIGGFAKVGNIE